MAVLFNAFEGRLAATLVTVNMRPERLVDCPSRLASLTPQGDGHEFS
jgi:hypothetical protein